MHLPAGNIRLKELFVLIHTTLIVLLVLLGVLSVLAYRNFVKLEQSNEIQYNSVAIAHELKESSDLLTQYCQTYVVTGDTIWERLYWEVLDIRNGIKPRADGRTIALRDSMTRLGFTPEELSTLKLAEHKSNLLVHTETVAFNAMKGLFEDEQGVFSLRGDPDTAFARTIVFDEKYRSDKSEIMVPIDDFIRAIEIRTKGQVTKYNVWGGWILGTIMVLIFIVSVISVVSFFIIRNRMIRQIRRMQETELQLRETNTTKDRLFSIIAHDLRSPFNGISGASELLLENMQEFNIAPEAEQYLNIISSSASDTLALLDNLLNWAKAQTGQIAFTPERVMLSAVIQGVIQLNQSRALLKNIQLVYQPQPDMEIKTDRNLLGVILLNLISNAIKFTPAEGRVEVVVNRFTAFVEIAVIDNGTGMSLAMQETIFDKTALVTQPGTAGEIGSGIGLVLCKEFAELLGGNIRVESETGKGSRFYLNFPVQD